MWFYILAALIGVIAGYAFRGLIHRTELQVGGYVVKLASRGRSDAAAFVASAASKL